MFQTLKTLAVVIFISLGVFSIARNPVSGLYEDARSYSRDVRIWIAMSIIAFVFESYALLVAFSILICAVQAPKHPQPLALYCLLLLCLPQLGQYFPAWKPLLFLEQNTVYATVLLLPVAIRLSKSLPTLPGAKSIDALVVAYCLWRVIVEAINASITEAGRVVLYQMASTFLPYYVASRIVKTPRDFARLGATLITASAILGAIAVFEFLWHWLLYFDMSIAMRGSYNGYLSRGSGLLRAAATLGNITLGYVMMIALGFYIFIHAQLKPGWKRLALLAAIIGGLVAPLARGPWIGVLAMGVAVVTLGPGASRRFAATVGIGGIVMIGLALTPLGETIYDLLPFVGSASTDTVDYRQRLFVVSQEVFWQNPVMGDRYYLRNPLMQQMIQGEGIIDMVNSYLGIALPYGIIGLLLFTTPPFLSLLKVWRWRKLHLINREMELQGRILIAVLLGILVTIGTVSDVGVIPEFYWMTIGLCAAYVRIPHGKSFSVALPQHSIQPASHLGRRTRSSPVNPRQASG